MPDRIMTLIDQMANWAGYFARRGTPERNQLDESLAALRAEAASMQKWRDDDLIARVAVEFTQDAIAKGKYLQLPLDESEVELLCRGAIGEARRRMVQRRLDAARATTPEGNHD